MGKNNKLINQMRLLSIERQEVHLHKVAEELTPQFYAITAIVLKQEFGFGQTRTLRLFEKVYELMQKYEYRGDQIRKDCKEITGISFVKNEGDKE